MKTIPYMYILKMERLYVMMLTLLKKKVFEPLKDINFFMNACTILNGTLAWDVTGTRDCSKCLDIDPEMLYGLENVSEKIA